MPFILRKIKNKRTWAAISHKERPDFAPPDCFIDLRTSQSTLSVWLIEDDKSNLLDVVAALAIEGGDIDHFHFVLAPIDRMPKGSSLTETDGKTPYIAARKFHRTLSGLTAQGIIEFVFAVLEGGEAPDYVEQLKIKKFLWNKYCSDTSEFEGLAETVVKDIETYGRVNAPKGR